MTKTSMRLLHALLLIAGLVNCACAAPLPSRVLDALKQARIPLSSVGIEVREVGAHAPLININAQKSMNPASTMKLLTTYAALEMLGPSYTWKTEAYIHGKLEQGVLDGDLILKGYGDPKLTIEQFWLWLRELRSRGLREIRGNLVLDRSAFESATHDLSAFDNDPLQPYNAGPDALLLNFNAVRLRFIPENEKINIISEPELAGLTLENRVVVTESGNCDNWDDNISTQLRGGKMVLQGTFPAGCGERENYVCLLPHPQYLYGVFRALWEEMGGTLSGELREGKLPPEATLFATHNSAQLSELIRDINKYSNNVMARQLFLSLSYAQPEAEENQLCDDGLPCLPDFEWPLANTQPPASIARTGYAIRSWLAKNDLHFPELVLENGAGLSRRERISPHNMARLLQAAQQNPLAAEYEASLPIAGIDGTLKKRFVGSPTARHAHLKTGSIKGVKSVAGYVQSSNGKQWIMVFFINHPNAAAGQPAQDALIEWLQLKR